MLMLCSVPFSDFIIPPAEHIQCWRKVSPNGKDVPPKMCEWHLIISKLFNFKLLKDADSSNSMRRMEKDVRLDEESGNRGFVTDVKL